jgi:hypothetical protein
MGLRDDLGKQLAAKGHEILAMQPNVIVQFRLLRDVLRFSEGSPELELALKAANSHAWVQELANEQHGDGSWGRFHSMDTSNRHRFPTSEIAIQRGLALGLDQKHPIMQAAIGYMTAILEGKAAWSDRVEKSEGWPISVEAITAGTLALVDAENPAIDQAWNYWIEIAGRSFRSGIYSTTAEWKAHKELRGVGIHYLLSRYVLQLLGAQGREIPGNLEKQLVGWIWNDPNGIGYLGADLRQPSHFNIFYWVESMEILSRFPSWHLIAEPAMGWLWEQCASSGLWDFRTNISKTGYFPLSDGWRRRGSRSIDHSTRILALFQRYVEKDE